MFLEMIFALKYFVVLWSHSCRMLAHKFVEQSLESDLDLRKQKAKKSWWSVGW